MPGVSSGVTVTYALPIRYAGMNRSSSPYTHTRRSLGGVRETYYYNAESSYSCQTKPLTPNQAVHMRQFLDSVADGQAFEFAPDGIGDWRDVVIESEGYSEAREALRDSMVSYSFSIVETTVP